MSDKKIIKNICVYCSSSNHLEQKFYNLAENLGMQIAQNNCNLVYGGTNVGSMGVLANAVLHNGGKAFGVIPERIQSMGLAHPALASITVTKDMRSRKAEMERLADAFIALPGGFGTFEEIFEILVAKQLGYHKKPIIFLNLDGFYNPLFEMFENVYNYKFAKEESRELYLLADTVEEIFPYLDTYKEIDFVLKW